MRSGPFVENIYIHTIAVSMPSEGIELTGSLFSV